MDEERHFDLIDAFSPTQARARQKAKANAILGVNPNRQPNVSAHNSNVFINSQVNIYVDILNADSVAAACSPEDQELAREFVTELTKYLEEKNRKKGFLARFGALISKYAPIAVSFAKLILPLVGE